MNFAKLFFIQLLLILFFTTTLPAQDQDSTVVYDTVTIYKEPFVINKTVVLQKTRTQKKSTFFFALTGGVNYYTSYNSVCEQCKEYYNTTQTTNKATIGYLAGIDAMYKPGRFFINYSLHYNQYREKFNFTDSTSFVNKKTNTLSYLDNLFGGGVRIGKDKNVQLLVSAQAKLSILSNVSGLSPDTASQKYVVTIREVHQYRKLLPGAVVSVQLLCRIAPSLYLMPAISYGYDLKSIVDNKGPYTIQRTLPSLKISLVKGL